MGEHQVVDEGDRIGVLAVVGIPRSGSTIVARLLGEVDGFVCVGEVRQLWWNLEADREHRCGCGDPLLACPFWLEVFERVGVDGTPASIRARAATQEAGLRRHHPWLGLPRLLRSRTGVPERSRPFARDLAQLYRAIAATAGATTVIDSSKKSDWAALATALAGVDGRLVHTVRDPRATLMSHHARRHADAPAASYPRDALVRSASWLLETAGAVAVTRRRASTRLRYDDFAAAPLDALAPIVREAGGDPATLPVDVDGQASLGPAHTAGGSPTRFDVGGVAVRRDDRWRTGLHRTDRTIAQLVTLPLRRVVTGRR